MHWWRYSPYRLIEHELQFCWHNRWPCYQSINCAGLQQHAPATDFYEPIMVYWLDNERHPLWKREIRRHLYTDLHMLQKCSFFNHALVMRQLLKEWEQRYGHCHSTTLFVSEKWLHYLFSSVKPSRLTSLFSSSLPRVHKHNLLSHTFCGRLLK